MNTDMLTEPLFLAEFVACAMCLVDSIGLCYIKLFLKLLEDNLIVAIWQLLGIP